MSLSSCCPCLNIIEFISPQIFQQVECQKMCLIAFNLVPLVSAPNWVNSWEMSSSITKSTPNQHPTKISQHTKSCLRMGNTKTSDFSLPLLCMWLEGLLGFQVESWPISVLHLSMFWLNWSICGWTSNN